MARAGRRGNLYAAQIDRSWMRYARCKLCGFKTCINNYPDHKPRVERVKGVFLCPWCKMRNLFALELYLAVKEVAKPGCKKGKDCGKCKPCKAAKLLANAQEFQPHNTILDTGI